MRNSDTADPFGTEQFRARVIETWRATPARFREDANSEEDFARGGYRDRLVVELLQNAADAAALANAASRVLIRIDANSLVVANTGQPLTRDGVGSLASLRASSKHHDGSTAGRFGVGFSSVLSISDEPALRSSSGGVHFSRTKTRGLVDAEPALASQLRQRDGHVPILRLPFPDQVAPPNGYDTAVVLPFRNGEARHLALELVNEIDDGLFLGLPALVELTVVVDDRKVRVVTVERSAETVTIVDGDDVAGWYVKASNGDIDPALLLDRPTEERRRGNWSISWAVPVAEDGRPIALPSRTSAVLHAPTPSAEPLDLPALLLGSFPLDSSRRHVATGPLCTFLVQQAALAYVDVLAELAESIGPIALDLVPPPAIVGAFDGQIRARIRELARERPLLRGLVPEGVPVPRDRAVVVESASVVVTPEVAAAVAAVIDGVVDPRWCASRVALTLIEPRRLSLADAFDELLGASLPPAWWHSFYESISQYELSSLEGLPVPLVGGRVVRNIRECFLPDSDAEPPLVLGLRVIDPAAAHPLLRRLGAQPGDPAALLGSDQLRRELTQQRSPDEARDFAKSVLRLVEDAGFDDDDRSTLATCLGQLSVPVQEDEWVALADALLPGSALAEVAFPDAWVIDAQFVAEVGSEAIVQAGALVELATRVQHDVLLDREVIDDLMADGAAWVDFVEASLDDDDIGSSFANDLLLVAGLDVVADDNWSRVWPMLVRPDVREAIIRPTIVTTGDGRRVSATSPAGWWLSEAPLFDGTSPRQAQVGADDTLGGLFASVVTPAGFTDRELLRAIGVATSVEDLLFRPDGAADLLSRLGDSDRSVSSTQLAAIYRALADLPEHLWPDPPKHVRVAHGEATQLVDASDAVVVVAPHHAALVVGSGIPGGERLAELLELRTSDEVVAGYVPAGGITRTVPAAIGRAFPGSPSTYLEHDELIVASKPVEWWVTNENVVHAATMDGLARGLAWASGAWSARWELAGLLADGDRADEALNERAFDA
ncbi:MAG TPA: molecular chaperone Hsp90 [Actinomycetes bacterium]|nr:molecular chaperone Hsp90 [Actinomycetes bacterium]